MVSREVSVSSSSELADHVSKRCLGEFLDCVRQIVYLIDGLLRIGDLKIEEALIPVLDIVAGDHLLRGEVVDLFAEVDHCGGHGACHIMAGGKTLDLAGVYCLGTIHKWDYEVGDRAKAHCGKRRDALSPASPIEAPP